MDNQLQIKLEVRPWGKFVCYTHNQASTVKIITVSPNQQLSLQYHSKRSEFWKILKGDPTITIGNKVVMAVVGDEFFVDKGVQHRIAANENQVEILEIAFGDFDETDIVRLEDKYGRQDQKI